MPRFVILVITLLLAGCASMANYYTSTVQSWRGGKASDLVKRWGTPDTQMTTPSGDTVYIYKTVSYSNYPASPSPDVGVHVGTNGRPVIVNIPNTNDAWDRGPMQLTCRAIFIANRQGLITDVRTSGTSCYGGEGFASSKRNPQMALN